MTILTILLTAIIIFIAYLLITKSKNKEELEEFEKELNEDDFGIQDFYPYKRIVSDDIDIKMSRGEVNQTSIVNKGKGQGKGGGGKPPKTSTTTTTTVGYLNSAVIMLDFVGGVVSGTSWNYNGDIIYSHSGFTITEQEQIVTEIYNDYSLFNVTVTTDEAVYQAADPRRRGRCIFTQSWEWYGQAGGVAYTNSFFWGDNTPCFVFNSLLQFNVKHCWEAGSHEIGHTIGLRHQATYDENCILTSSYNYGNSIEAPIMGVAYYAQNGKWWIGPTVYGCREIQDDVAILTTKLGLSI